MTPREGCRPTPEELLRLLELEPVAGVHNFHPAYCSLLVKFDALRISHEELEEILRDYVAYSALHNICGTTAMSVPLHWDSIGLPLGSQFAARMGGEATLLSLAYELEEARPWTGKRPPTFVE